MSRVVSIAALACLVFGGCKQRQHVARDNIAVVERAFAQTQDQARHGARDVGLTTKEVESVLGPPHRIDPPETSLRDVEVFRYYYQQGDDTYELHFFESKLIQMARLDDPRPPSARLMP